ncbi:cysteine proteinase [Microthyrium microscopicum]|uniref:Cysteine proteinase n=1 Tax=Microthyrium microscopicum TaxID=703497 RepID=A0A6A6U3W5_9PEZI|nr:cysteine proteinase [Microthyrium microscopicum]
MSPNGRYLFRFNFNGCRRAVEIDDSLPVSKTKRMLHIIDRNNPTLLWPALIEKAYLKVRGGYDFPGSNSNTDLWIITGWIPEIVFLQQASPDNLWKRMKGSFEEGNLLMTTGTGKMSPEVEAELGLVSQHNYAILDLREENGREMVLIKNPWCEETLWDSEDLASKDKNGNFTPKPRARPLSKLPPAGNHVAPGTFWMTLNDMFHNFEFIYLNWNPAMFRYRQDIHFQWDMATASRATNTLARNPQFSLTVENGGPVWLLLCRHLTMDARCTVDEEADKPTKKLSDDSKEASAFESLISEVAASTGSSEYDGHINLYVFDNDGKRVYNEAGAMEQGRFVDSMQTLLRMQTPKGKSPRYTVVVGEQNLPATMETFSLSAFALDPIKISHVTNTYSCSHMELGEWNMWNAGGSTTSPSFSINPQWSVEVHQPTAMALLLECYTPERNVNVKLCYGGGKRLYLVKNQDIILDSKEYRKGSSFVQSRVMVEPGKYTIVASTFEAKQYGRFKLSIETNTDVKVKVIPAEDFCKATLRLPTAVFRGSVTKLAIKLDPLRGAAITAIFKYSSSYIPPVNQSSTSDLMDDPLTENLPLRSPMRISLMHGRGDAARVLGKSYDGQFSDETIMGLRVFDVPIYRELSRKGDMFLVAERLGQTVDGSEERYEASLLIADADKTAVRPGNWEVWED